MDFADGKYFQKFIIFFTRWRTHLENKVIKRKGWVLYRGSNIELVYANMSSNEART